MLRRAWARTRGTGPGTRAAGVVAAIVVVSIVASALAGDTTPTTARAPGDVAKLLEGEGKIVVDPRGKPVLGPDGKPLRVAPDGRTLLDSSGRPLRDAAGRPLRLRAGNRLPPELRRGPAGRRKADERHGKGRRVAPGRGSPTPSPSPDRSPIVLAALYQKAESVRKGGQLLLIDTEPGDSRAQLQALEAHVNATGGVDGRRLVIRAEEYDQYERRTHDEAAHEQARRLAEGQRPHAAIAAYGRPALLVPRLAAAGIPLMTNWPWSPSRSLFQTWPDHVFALNGAPLELLAAPYIDGLRSTGFFGKEKVGVLTWDMPWWREGNEALRRELRRAGVRNHVEAAFATDNGGPDALTRLSRDVADAVVRFQLAGVKKVVGFDQAGLAMMTFMLAAETRGAKFVYGLNTTHAPETIAAQPTRRGQLGGAVGVGWSPVFDVPRSQEPASEVGDACRRIYDDAGAFVGDRSWFGEYTALTFCENVLAFRAAVESSGSPTPSGLRAGMEALGSSFGAPTNLATLLGPGRHYGSAGFRRMRYHRACTCFRYEGAAFGG